VDVARDAARYLAQLGIVQAAAMADANRTALPDACRFLLLGETEIAFRMRRLAARAIVALHSFSKHADSKHAIVVKLHQVGGPVPAKDDPDLFQSVFVHEDLLGKSQSDKKMPCREPKRDLLRERQVALNHVENLCRQL
jgi:hypothetical protein